MLTLGALGKLASEFSRALLAGEERIGENTWVGLPAGGALRRLLSWMVFPGVLGGALASAWIALSLGVPHGPIATVSVLVAAGTILLLQRLMPYRRDWLVDRGEFGLDLMHSVVSTGGASALFEALAFGLLVHFGAVLSSAIGATAWPVTLPLGAQLLLALVIGELGQYTVHRASHEIPLLWRIHALHHSSERLYMLSSGRNHPISTLLSYGAHVTPLLLLGAGADVLLILSVFTAVHGLLQHANIDMRFGPFNALFATADYHRWHHSTRLEEGNANYGSNLIVFDRLLGTACLPARRRVERVGLHGAPPFPEGFLGHLASPFTYERWGATPAVSLRETSDNP